MSILEMVEERFLARNYVTDMNLYLKIIIILTYVSTRACAHTKKHLKYIIGR